MTTRRAGQWAGEMDELVRAVQVARELALRRGDPLLLAYRGLTERQKAFIHSPAPKRVVEGGNRSGKTWSHIIDRLLQARGLHPARSWTGTGRQSWVGWYGAVSYELFGLQAWAHYKRLLLYPGETVHRLPTRNILAIGWNKKNPEVPDYVRIRREGGEYAEEWIKSFEQGAGAFQSGSADCLGLDEECPEDIYRESTLRVLDTNGNMILSATPINGAVYLAKLRERNEREGAASVFHVRLPTVENPALTQEAIGEITHDLGGDEELIKLRLHGYPVAMHGLVYNDQRFRSEHVCDYFSIPVNWTRYRWIDPGYNFCACLWLAVSPKNERIVAYRDYVGRNRTIEENAIQIQQMSVSETYARTWFDRYYVQKHEAVKGEKILDLWRKAGIPGFESVDVGVMPAIHGVWKLLNERAGVNGEIPKFQVMRHACPNFLEERRTYKFPDAREKGDERPTENPVKRNDNVMDCWKGAVACGLKWVPPAPPVPPRGSMGELLMQDRQRPREGRL